MAHDSAGISRRALIGATAAITIFDGVASAQTPSPMASPAASPVAADVPVSTAFSTVDIANAVSVASESDGDLWPMAWADDDALYTLCGDGKGFYSTGDRIDVVANRVTGTPTTAIKGERLAHGLFVGEVWGDQTRYNRKPTGLIAVDGNGDGKDELYAAIQDLKYGDRAFDDAPNASISVSTDYGKTWKATTEPMFTDHRFTTVMFLDFGQSSKNRTVLGEADSGYAYAYGLDHNWRDSFSDAVADPTDLYLARVPIASIQQRETWEFFAGMQGDRPTWERDIEHRMPVLSDHRRIYTELFVDGPKNMSVISQGGIVYNAPLKRYLYTSWTEFTFEFYEAPQPWGPWSLFARKDFGAYPWFGLNGGDGCPGPKNGGYGTIIPSKFISEDGTEMWLQSNWWVGNGCGDPTYSLAFRKVRITPHAPEPASNTPNDKANLAKGNDAVIIERATHFGRTKTLKDGTTDLSEDSWTGERKDEDWWGYTWPTAMRMNRLVYTTGQRYPDGGWFEHTPRVQVRNNHTWTEVKNVTVSPDYPQDDSIAERTAFTFTFDTTEGDGIRIVGKPAGDSTFTTISELEVYLTS